MCCDQTQSLMVHDNLFSFIYKIIRLTSTMRLCHLALVAFYLHTVQTTRSIKNQWVIGSGSYCLSMSQRQEATFVGLPRCYLIFVVFQRNPTSCRATVIVFHSKKSLILCQFVCRRNHTNLSEWTPSRTLWFPWLKWKRCAIIIKDYIVVGSCAKLLFANPRYRAILEIIVSASIWGVSMIPILMIF